MVGYYANPMKTLISICLFCLLADVQAQTIYKTIDAEGKVSYSTTRPDETEKAEIIEAPREPSKAEIEAAQQRQTQLETSVKQSRDKRKTKELEQNLELDQSKKERQRKIEKNKGSPGLMF